MRTVLISGAKISVAIIMWFALVVSLGALIGMATYYVFEQVVTTSTGCGSTYEWTP